MEPDFRVFKGNNINNNINLLKHLHENVDVNSSNNTQVFTEELQLF